MPTERTHKAELVWRVRDELEKQLKTDIATTDPARVRLVIVGRYTGEPNGKILSVHASHPLGFDGRRHDSIAEGTPRTLFDRPWELPPESLGGSMWDLLFCTVQLRSLQERSPENAVEVIDTILTRIAHVINTAEGLVPFEDAYGNQVFGLRTASRYGYASGGDDTSVDSHWVDFTAHVSSTRNR